MPLSSEFRGTPQAYIPEPGPESRPEFMYFQVKLVQTSGAEDLGEGVVETREDVEPVVAPLIRCGLGFWGKGWGGVRVQGSEFRVQGSGS